MDGSKLRSTGEDEVSNEQQGVRNGDTTVMRSNDANQVVNEKHAMQDGGITYNGQIPLVK
jgi:hypothetical protein